MHGLDKLNRTEQEINDTEQGREINYYKCNDRHIIGRQELQNGIRYLCTAPGFNVFKKITETTQQNNQ